MSLTSIISIYSFLMFFMTIVSSTALRKDTAPLDQIIFWLMGIIPLIFMHGLIGGLVRMNFASKLGLTGSGGGICGSCVECCKACVCGPCSTAQMSRHLFGYNKVLDGDADVNQSDRYDV